MSIDIRAVEAFLAVVGRRSFTSAALATGMSEAVLSRLVRSLEAELSADLLERRGAQGVAPTEFGELFATQAPRVTAAHRRFSELAQRLHAGVVGTITLGWPAHGLGPLGDEVLRAVRRRLPDLDLRTVHPSLDAQLRPLTDRTCDLMLVREWVPVPAFASTGPVAAEDRVLGVSASSPLAAAGGTEPDRLRGVPIVPAGRPASAASGDAWGPFPRGADGEQTLVPVRPAATVDELFRRVRADEGVCLVPAALARSARPDEIAFTPAPGLTPSRASFVWRRDSADAALRSMIDVLVDTAAGLPELGGMRVVRQPIRS